MSVGWLGWGLSLLKTRGETGGHSAFISRATLRNSGFGQFGFSLADVFLCTTNRNNLREEPPSLVR